MKLRKAFNLSYVLFPIVILMIGIPVFRFIYTAKAINNTKKVLQEAAYAGALAGTYAIDIDNFQYGREGHGRSTTIDTYPNDSETNSPAAFMRQSSKRVRFNNGVKSEYDALGSDSSVTYPGVPDDLASNEIVATVEEYLENALNMIHDDSSSKASYTKDDYGIAMKFERSDLKSKSGSGIADDGKAPYNKVTVSVILKYKPTMLKGLEFFFGENISDEVIIYGTSSAKTKSIT